MTTPSLHDEMRSVIANLEAREWHAMERDGAVNAYGAVMTCRELRPGDAQIILAVMRHRGLTLAWEGEDGRTKADVLERLRSIEVSDADLEQTFGASWRLVMAAIRRAAVLTEDEAKRLAAALPPSRDAALIAHSWAVWSAGRLAGRVAAWERCWMDAWEAAREGVMWTPARERTRDAVQDAVTACVTADLIGQRGYTQAHHDTLMQPWISALGDGWADVVA